MRRKASLNRKPLTRGSNETFCREDLRMSFHRHFVSACSAKRRLIGATVAATFFVVQPIWSQGPKHPLDGLTPQEIWTAYETLQASHKVDADTRFPMVQLHEPPKEQVLAWKPGQGMGREAFMVVRQGTQMFEAVVNVNGKKLVSWREMKGVQPNMPHEEEGEMGDAVKEDPEVQKALKLRNITDPWNVVCAGGPEGYFNSPEEQERRLLRVVCFKEFGAVENWSPITGLSVVWDNNAKKVVRVVDTGVAPLIKSDRNYSAVTGSNTRDAGSPLVNQQASGPGFRLNGQTVNWQNWNFHFRIDRRVGLVVSNVAYQDGNKLRSILYEGSLSELFMAYMEASENWSWAAFFDIGESGSGFSSSMEVGNDCPDNAVYFDQAYADWHGIAQVKPRAACLFEEPAGSMAWRHDDGSFVESRKMRNLILRTIGTFDNYDYVCDWIFQQNGAIRVRVGATGEDNISAVKSRTAAEDHTGQDGRYGRFIAENTVGINHDHFFSFRLDFDVDGAANSFVRDKIQMKRLPPDSLRKSLWVAEPEVAKTEEQAKARMSMERPEYWRIVNPNVKSSLGYPVGYELAPGENAVSLLVPEDYPQKRAGFTDYHIWVTPYRQDERYAAGDYPFQSKGGDGLPAWTKANRPIENTDIVLWYTMGFHHVPHSEDWPVMPTVWHEFELRPSNFFEHNPALDLPK
jgi:primary-amine oxidase